ncbi:hypothetical protein Q9L58_009802 [Maublancomyces gigas]|uniref:Uncharacterized protein n=1 Tax=Discina gigas TaxID=1032678 RepID=A0ABR3G6J4_9PEZI
MVKAQSTAPAAASAATTFAPVRKDIMDLLVKAGMEPSLASTTAGSVMILFRKSLDALACLPATQAVPPKFRDRKVMSKPAAPAPAPARSSRPSRPSAAPRPALRPPVSPANRKARQEKYLCFCCGSHEHLVAACLSSRLNATSPRPSLSIAAAPTATVLPKRKSPSALRHSRSRPARHAAVSAPAVTPAPAPTPGPAIDVPASMPSVPSPATAALPPRPCPAAPAIRPGPAPAPTTAPASSPERVVNNFLDFGSSSGPNPPAALAARPGPAPAATPSYPSVPCQNGMPFEEFIDLFELSCHQAGRNAPQYGDHLRDLLVRCADVELIAKINATLAVQDADQPRPATALSLPYLALRNRLRIQDMLARLPSR